MLPRTQSPKSRTIPLLYPVVTNEGVKFMRLYREWKVYIDKDLDKYVLIPEGSGTDFATIFFLMRWLLSKTDPVLVLPAIVHDYLVQQFKTGEKPVIYSRAAGDVVIDYDVDWFEAAKIFRSLIRMYDGSTVMLKSHLAYYGVKLYGYVRPFMKKRA